ncbi:MAG: calcium-binding protein, partial [Dongiaceae bacterium]
GIDLVTYQAAGGGVTVNLTAKETTTDGDSGQDTLEGIENVRGSTAADHITGDVSMNFLEGLNGDDTLIGGDDDDALAGGADSDLLTGGPGVDTFVLSIALSAGNDTVSDFDGSNEVLRFEDVVDIGGPAGVDLTDLVAVTTVTDDGADVTLNFASGASVVLEGVGTGFIATITDLVADASQIVVTS